MATDVEESDTDEHERPVPAKRQRMRDSSPEPSVEVQEEQNNVEMDEEEKRAREKLRGWQACQVAKGFVDNTINRVLEDYIKTPPSSYPFEYPWYRLFRGNEMEDTAVTMAIRNHGLVRAMDFAQAQSLFEERVPDFPSDMNDTSLHTATTSADNSIRADSEFRNSEIAGTSGETSWSEDNYEKDQQQDFMDRAVAEAIKKKGLSALSVDYG